MRNLLDFLARYNYWLLFIVLEAASVTMIVRFNSYQGSVYFTNANAVAGQVYEWRSEIDKFFSLTHVNERLTQRNIQLEYKLNKLEERLADIENEATVPAAITDNAYSYIEAKVVSNSLNRRDNLITINKGSSDGVRSDMGVVCGNGVVGTVFLTSEHYSIVIPILSSKSNISVAIKHRGYYGYLNWEGGDPTTVYVEDVPRHARFAIGDLIVTSGYSAIFPAGIVVGQVLHVYNSTDGLSYRIKARLATDFGNLRDVCVINDSRIKEQADIMRAATDSLNPTHK